MTELLMLAISGLLVGLGYLSLRQPQVVLSPIRSTMALVGERDWQPSDDLLAGIKLNGWCLMVVGAIGVAYVTLGFLVG
jgi:hypothetical protein